MRAIVITQPGPPAVLRLVERAAPEPAPREVRVAVRAVGVNRADLLQRRGLYPAPPGVTQEIPGLEFAGEVERVGAEARCWQLGDRVMGILAGGAYAELVTVHEGLCARVPDRMSWEEAAALPEATLTAWEALFPIGKLSRDETVLVTAAASGVGTAAIQLARESGARVVATSRSPGKRKRLEALGPHAVLDPDHADWPQALHTSCPGGVDLILDLVGRPGWSSYLEVANERGRIVVVGLLGGSRVEIDLAAILGKRLVVSGTVLRPRRLEEKLALVRRWADAVVPAVEAGRIRPIVDRVFPLEQAGAAHAHVEANASFGRVVLAVGAKL